MPSKYSDRPYAVGKGKPPVHTQFGKNRPGNSAGRPVGARNADTIIAKAFGVRLSVTEDGKERKMSKLEAAITQLANKAASGDLGAIAMVLRIHRDAEARAISPTAVMPLNEADRMVLEQFVARVRDPKVDYGN